MRIAAIEPYAALSHVQFLEGLRKHPAHDVEILSLPARGWKWRMRTASVRSARVLEARAAGRRALHRPLHVGRSRPTV